MEANPSGLCLCGCGRKTNLAGPDHVRHGYEAGEPLRFIHGHHRRGKKHTAESRQKMSEATKVQIARDGHPWTGRHHTAESKRRFRESHSGEKHWNWKGGRYMRDGYYDVLVGRDHPMSRANGYCREHRLVMAGVLGRMLEPGEVVHHRNGIKTDNRPENLELMQHGQHTRLSRFQRSTAEVERIAALLAEGRSPAEVAVLVTEERLNT